MTTILEQYCAMQEETTYGTAVTTSLQGYEATGDNFTRNVEFIEGNGKRRGRVALKSNRRKKIDRGATGDVESFVLTRGEGLRLKNLLGSAPSAPSAVQSQTGAFRILTEADTVGPRNSYSVVVARSDTGGTGNSPTMRYFTYAGCVATSFTLNISENSELTMGVTYDAQSESAGDTAPTAPTYPDDDSTEMFCFEGASVTLGGTQINHFESFSCTGDLMMDTERYFLRNSVLKARPIRNGLPSFSGTLSGEFADLIDYERFVNGQIVPLEFICVGTRNIGSSTQLPTFKVTFPAVQFNGTTPASSLDSLSTIELPFMALGNASNKVCSIEYISADSTY